MIGVVWLGESTGIVASSSTRFTLSKFQPGEGPACEVDTLPVSLSQAAKPSDDGVGAERIREVCNPLLDGVPQGPRLNDLDLRPLFFASRLYWHGHPTAGLDFRLILRCPQKIMRTHHSSVHYTRRYFPSRNSFICSKEPGKEIIPWIPAIAACTGRIALVTSPQYSFRIPRQQSTLALIWA